MDHAQQRPVSFGMHPPRQVDTTRVCQTCTHWHGRFKRDLMVCEHPRWPTYMSEARIKLGCAFWEREPGADDE